MWTAILTEINADGILVTFSSGTETFTRTYPITKDRESFLQEVRNEIEARSIVSKQQTAAEDLFADLIGTNLGK